MGQAASGVGPPAPRRRRFALLAALPLAAVAGLVLAVRDGPPPLVFDPEAPPDGPVETVLVSTVRAAGPGPELFAADPGETIGFGRYRIAVPGPGAGTGASLVVAEADRLADEAAFVEALNAQLASLAVQARAGAIFVHGFRNSFEDSLRLQAELQAELQSEAAVVLFAWAATPWSHAYVRDFDRALAAREGLERTIALVAKSGAEEITLVASSLGAFILMEALRGLARDGNEALFDRIAAVILISADIALDVFRDQAATVAARGAPIYVASAEGDRALWLSAMLRGEARRLGSLPPEVLAELPVVVIDASDRVMAESYRHLPLARAPDLIRLVQALGPGDGVGALRLEP